MKTYTNPQFPGKTFRRLDSDELIHPGDLLHFTTKDEGDKTLHDPKEKVHFSEGEILYYREVIENKGTFIDKQSSHKIQDFLLADTDAISLSKPNEL